MVIIYCNSGIMTEWNSYMTEFYFLSTQLLLVVLNEIYLILSMTICQVEVIIFQSLSVAISTVGLRCQVQTPLRCLLLRSPHIRVDLKDCRNMQYTFIFSVSECRCVWSYLRSTFLIPFSLAQKFPNFFSYWCLYCRSSFFQHPLMPPYFLFYSGFPRKPPCQPGWSHDLPTSASQMFYMRAAAENPAFQRHDIIKRN